MTPTINNPSVLESCPQAVVFDTDNTLYPYDQPHAKATRAAVQKACKLLGTTPGEFNAAFNSAQREVKAQLGATASSHSRLLYFQRAIEVLGMRTQLLMTLDIEQTYWRTFLSESHLFPDVAEFVLDLRSADVRTAIVTDLTAQIQFRKIIYFGLDDYFDYVVTSEEAGADKPARAPFEITLAKLGVPPDRTWVIGDNAETDIRGCRSFGMVAVQKIHDGVKLGTGDVRPDIVFRSFGSLRRLFASQGWVRDVPTAEPIPIEVPHDGAPVIGAAAPGSPTGRQVR